MYHPCLSYPLPASGSIYPRDLYPLLDWREGGNLRKYVQQSAAVRAPSLGRAARGGGQLCAAWAVAQSAILTFAFDSGE